ncbi:AMP-binding protein [Micrococcoides hystricis]|uniref:AMP-binding protein n=1 Tax=Micrococcoides hystricis TaxID=1572761 RepID=A0ABV6PBA4_9MICC
MSQETQTMSANTPTLKTVNINPLAGIEHQVKYMPGTEAIIYENDRYSYAELYREYRAVARMLAANGVNAGDRVVYLGQNSMNYVTTMLACWQLGAVFVPFNFRLAPREMDGLMAQAEPVMLIAEPSHQGEVEIMAGYETALPDVRYVLVDDDPYSKVKPNPADFWVTSTDAIHAARDVELPETPVVGEDDLAILMFTSGTTGKPKGVELTYGNLFWNAVNVDTLVDTRRGDTNLAVAPLFHIGGLNALFLRLLVRGGRSVIRRNFDPVQTLKDIEEYQVNQAFLVPAMLSAMQAQPEFEHAKLDSLRALICAGAPVPPIVIKQYETKGVPVQQAWGLTETAPFATYLPTEHTYTKTGSCGIPMPFTEIKLIDPATMEDITEPNQTGEMLVRGANVTRGYWRNPTAVASAFTEDGWFRSGDMGYRDEEGYYYIVDRLKDMIVTGGENVYPAEVERVLMEYPGVTDAAVVGRPDPKWGEAVVAVVSFAGEDLPTAESVREFTAKYLARYKLPKELVLTAQVPRNSSGKLDKLSIRKMVSDIQDD